MTQRYEVEAWVNPSAWDDPAEAERAIEAILESGSTDEAEWLRIIGAPTEAVADGAERGFDRAERAAADAWLREDVAEFLGVRPDTVSSYVHRGHLPPPDGRLGRTPWWHPETVRAWERPGRGARTDLQA